MYTSIIQMLSKWRNLILTKYKTKYINYVLCSFSFSFKYKPYYAYVKKCVKIITSKYVCILAK